MKREEIQEYSLFYFKKFDFGLWISFELLAPKYIGRRW
jgi:hypothetical protein